MKTYKKIITAIVCVLLIAAIIVLSVFFGHYGEYKSKEKPVDVPVASVNGELNIMSCNLRCLNPNDLGKKSWYYRADLIIQNLVKEAPDVIGFQECTKQQYSYLNNRLTQYDNIMTYRDSTAIAEGCPIYYRSDKYTLVDKNSFWLSETPDKMSKDWDAACYRICSYAILQDNATGTKFVVFNTHLDHVSELARINGINLVLEKIKEFGNLPAMIMGDFNAEEDSETYRSATENFLDVKYQTENTMKSCTYQNYGKALDSECIDYLMISKTGFKVNSYKVVQDTYDGAYPSDHFPLSVKLEFDS